MLPTEILNIILEHLITILLKRMLKTIESKISDLATKLDRRISTDGLMSILTQRMAYFVKQVTAGRGKERLKTKRQRSDYRISLRLDLSLKL